jgi:hypothetical protein
MNNQTPPPSTQTHTPTHQKLTDDQARAVVCTLQYLHALFSASPLAHFPKSDVLKVIELTGRDQQLVPPDMWDDIKPKMDDVTTPFFSMAKPRTKKGKEVIQ